MIYFFESSLKMPLMPLPVRATLVKGPESLVLISPIRFTEEQVAQIRQIGEVTDIVAPSLLHHLAIPKAVQHFPKATLWGAPDLHKKRADIAWQKILAQDPWPSASGLEPHLIRGAPKLNEVVFLEKQSRTLIATDLCFNLQDARGLGAFLILSYFGTYRRFGVSRFWLRYVKDKEAFLESLRVILSWDFDKIVMAHGHVIESGGKSLLQASLRERGLKI